MRSVSILIIAILLLGCNSGNQQSIELLKKENELLKLKLQYQNQESKDSIKTKKPDVNKNSKSNPKPKNRYKTINEDITELKQLLNGGDWDVVLIDIYGNFSFDMGAASAGRVSGNLRDVILSIEYQPERPGCADICPPMEIIHFNCLNGKNCIEDPAMKDLGKYESGMITFVNLEMGRKTYKLLREIQDKIQ